MFTKIEKEAVMIRIAALEQTIADLLSKPSTKKQEPVYGEILENFRKSTTDTETLTSRYLQEVHSLKDENIDEDDLGLLKEYLEERASILNRVGLLKLNEPVEGKKPEGSILLGDITQEYDDYEDENSLYRVVVPTKAGSRHMMAAVFTYEIEAEDKIKISEIGLWHEVKEADGTVVAGFIDPATVAQYCFVIAIERLDTVIKQANEAIEQERARMEAEQATAAPAAPTGRKAATKRKK